MNTLDLLNRKQIEKGALDGSKGFQYRYYTVTVAVVMEGSDKPEFLTNFYKTLDSAFEAAEEILTRQSDNVVTLTSHAVSQEELEKIFSETYFNE